MWESKAYTHVANGRDATNSGMQILGSVCGDRDAMVYTNVIPSDVPQDLYGFVAEKAQTLLRNDCWVSDKMAKYRKIQEKAIKKAMKENRPWNAPEHQDGLTIDPALVTRSTLKRAVMCTSYNAGWGSKNEYIQEQLKEDEVEFSYIDSKLVTDASIEALSMAFPKTDELQVWFKALGKAAMDKGLTHLQWTTPNGSHIVQEYRELITNPVRTHAMGGGNYPLVSLEDSANPEERVRVNVHVGWGDVKENKHGTALGANFTHSLDAAIIQNTASRWSGDAYYTVHDCFYARAGEMTEMCSLAREEFYNVVTSKPMHSLVGDNELDLETPTQDNTFLLKDTQAHSTYMFS